jgi:hypothetical protein
VVDWWHNYREYKVLPFEGDLNDQPAYVADAIKACHDEGLKIQAERAERERQEMDRLAKANGKASK